MDVALLILFLKIDITQGVDNKDLAILSNNPLALSRGTLGRIAGLRLALCLAALPARGAALFALLLRLLHASLLPVHGLRRAILVRSRRGCRRRRGWHLGSRDARATPCRLTGELDVALHKLGLTLPAHVEDDVVHAATAQQEHTNHDCSEARSVPVVVVIRALPQGEAIPQKVIIAIPLRPLQDVHNQRQARLRLARLLDGLVEGALGGLLRIGALGLAVGLELLLDLVRVQGARLGAVGLGDVVDGGGWRDAENVVEGR